MIEAFKEEIKKIPYENPGKHKQTCEGIKLQDLKYK